MLPLPPQLADLIGDRSWTRVTAGESGGSVFRIGEDLYLKYGRGAVAADIVDEHGRLVWLRGRVPAPGTVHFTAAGEDAWLLATSVPGTTAEDLLEDPSTDPSAVARLLGAFLRDLHRLPADDCPFDAGHAFRLRQARANIDAGRVDLDDFGDARQGWTAEQVWSTLHEHLPLDAGRVVTHGDFSAGNILIADGRVTGMIDVGRLGLADPYQDLAILWDNLEEHGPGVQQAFLASYGEAEPDPRRLRFHLLLDELF